MKLKKLFWGNPSFFKLIIIFSLLFSGCNSSKLIPGYSEVEKQELYSDYFSIANEYLNLKNYDKALFYFQKCLNSEKHHLEAFYKISLIYVYKAQWDDAIKNFNILLQKDKDNSSLKETIAYCYAMKGDKQKAIDLYINLIETDGNKVSYYENLISIYISDKNIEDAENYLSIIKEKFPDLQNIQLFTDKINQLKQSENIEN